MRQQADEIEATAKKAVEKAEENWAAALGSTGGAVVHNVPGIAGNGLQDPGIGNVAAMKAKAEAEQKAHQEKIAESELESAERAREEAEKYAAARKELDRFFDDEAIVPPFLDGDATTVALYGEALESINNRITSPDWKGLKFGSTAGKFIVAFERGGQASVYIFDPRDLIPQIETRVRTGAYGGKSVIVGLQCRNGNALIEKHDTSEGTSKVSQLWLEVSDELKMKKVVSALSTLIQAGGGKEEIFSGAGVTTQ